LADDDDMQEVDETMMKKRPDCKRFRYAISRIYSDAHEKYYSEAGQALKEKAKTAAIDQINKMPDRVDAGIKKGVDKVRG